MSYYLLLRLAMLAVHGALKNVTRDLKSLVVQIELTLWHLNIGVFIVKIHQIL